MATLNIKNFDDALNQRLHERAARQHRSVAQEVTQILAEILDESGQLSLLDLEGLGKRVWNDGGAMKHVSDERASWD